MTLHELIIDTVLNKKREISFYKHLNTLAISITDKNIDDYVRKENRCIGNINELFYPDIPIMIEIDYINDSLDKSIKINSKNFN